VDLVFYNRLLRCYVLIDLKLDELTHQDLGQMQMYVNYYDREVKLAEENPTIGLLLCQSKKQTIVELTLPRDANIHAREYELYLPSKELLKAKLIEWTRQESMKAEGGIMKSDSRHPSSFKLSLKSSTSSPTRLVRWRRCGSWCSNSRCKERYRLRFPPTMQSHLKASSVRMRLHWRVHSDCGPQRSP